MSDEVRRTFGERMRDTTTPFAERLRILCGYIENASDTSVRVCQDDATRDWIVAIGTGSSIKRSYHGTSMEEAFEQAFQDPKNDPEA